MLRASVEIQGQQVDVSAVSDRDATSGVPHGEVLTAFADAAVRRDDDLPAKREAVHEAVGDAGLIDACGIVANFQRMVRIADSTGIPLDAPAEMMSADLRGDIGVESFPSASNTPDVGAVQRVAGNVLRPVISTALRAIGAVKGKVQ